ncbi:hypothetical protein L6452_40679 [Arctium lappa]|uniref:Uncharacterized protein n=1 Tax=Arctium lappa TaxID=4217 RepID=A0ACB8XNS0_ARCLA|nr:hypothetical protein L6452_40679 [Arctium lappa]
MGLRGHSISRPRKKPTSQPIFLIELQTPIGNLIKEMVSWLELGRNKRFAICDLVCALQNQLATGEIRSS